MSENIYQTPHAQKLDQQQINNIINKREIYQENTQTFVLQSSQLFHHFSIIKYKSDFHTRTQGTRDLHLLKPNLGILFSVS